MPDNTVRIRCDGLRAYIRIENPDVSGTGRFELDLNEAQLMQLVRDIAEVLYGHFKLESTKKEPSS